MSQKENYQYLKKQHRCVNCTKQDAYTLAGRARCYECSEKNRNGANKYRNKNKDEVNKKRQKKYASLRAEHICLRCRKPLSLEDYGKHIYCSVCRGKAREYKKSKRIEKGYATQEYRVSGYVCYICCKNPPMEGRKVCKDCYDRIMSTMVATNIGRKMPRVSREAAERLWAGIKNDKTNNLKTTG